MKSLQELFNSTLTLIDKNDRTELERFVRDDITKNPPRLFVI